MIEWYGYRFPVGLGGHQVWKCSRCGALVDDRRLHIVFHEELDGK